jgi:hypothetical protein
MTGHLRSALKCGPKSVALAALALAALQTSCSSDGLSADGAVGVRPPSGNLTVDAVTGSVTVTVKFPGSMKQSNVYYWITGPDAGATILASGSVMVNSNSAGFTIGNIPVGNWAIVLNTGTDAGTSCAATATFTIASSGGNTSVTQTLTCGAADAGAGWAALGASLSECATANYVSAVPAEVKVGSSLQLTGSGSAPNPSALTYQWSAPTGTGTFGTPTATSTTFTCSKAGPVTVTFAVTDGPTTASGICPASLTTRTAQITCD